MKRFLAPVILLVVVLLSACSTTQLELDLPTAELEVQAVTSLSDSESITHLRIRNDAGDIVATRNDLINRITVFELMPGEYTVEGRVYSEDGSVYTEATTVVGADTELLLDLTEEVGFFWGSGSGTEAVLEAHFMSRPIVDKTSDTILLDFEQSHYQHTGFYTLSNVESINLVSEKYVHDSHIAFQFTPDDSGVTILFPSRNVIVTMAYDGTNCGREIGEYEVTWVGENTKKIQTMNPIAPCKG